MPPTPYPAPPLPPVPAGMFGTYMDGKPGDPRNGGAVQLPAPTPPAAPPPPFPPLPPVPLADFSTVGQRFLPRVTMPKAEVNQQQDLDYEGNPIPIDPHYNLPPGWSVAQDWEGKTYFSGPDGKMSYVHPAHPLF